MVLKLENYKFIEKADLELNDDKSHDLRQYDIERYTELWPPHDTFP